MRKYITWCLIIIGLFFTAWAWYNAWLLALLIGFGFYYLIHLVQQILDEHENDWFYSDSKNNRIFLFIVLCLLTTYVSRYVLPGIYQACYFKIDASITDNIETQISYFSYILTVPIVGLVFFYPFLHIKSMLASICIIVPIMLLACAALYGFFMAVVPFLFAAGLVIAAIVLLGGGSIVVIVISNQ